MTTTEEKTPSLKKCKYSTHEYVSKLLGKETMRIKNNLKKKLICAASAAGTAAVLMLSFTEPVFAASDPIGVVNNLSDFIFGLIRAVGIILLGWGIVQVGLSFQSHDPSQRSNGFLTLAGGVIITFAKEILNLIIG